MSTIGYVFLAVFVLCSAAIILTMQNSNPHRILSKALRKSGILDFHLSEEKLLVFAKEDQIAILAQQLSRMLKGKPNVTAKDLCCMTFSRLADAVRCHQFDPKNFAIVKAKPPVPEEVKGGKKGKTAATSNLADNSKLGKVGKPAGVQLGKAGQAR